MRHRKSSQDDTKEWSNSMTIFALFQEMILWIRHYMSPVLDIFTHFNSTLKKRALFEELNLHSRSSQSFLSLNQQADLCFEISSEGEWEQVAALVRYELELGKLIEIIYSSPSLESKMNNLFEQHPLQLRCLRLPLLSAQFLFSWVTAKTLILCRYDFFPELLALKWHNSMRLILVSGTLKNKNLSSILSRMYLKSLYANFDLIFTATESDRRQLCNLGLDDQRITSFEFRNGQIIKRQEAKEDLLDRRRLQSFIAFLTSFSREKRIVFGSCWPSEMELLGDLELQKAIKSGERMVVLAPHQLSAEFISDLQAQIKRYAPQLPVQLIDSHTTSFDKGALYILLVPGILCESYSLYGTAYVGGGFGRSIHSVSEPFWGACRIVVGPKTHRSTEFDFVSEFSREDISVVPQLKDIAQALLQDDSDRLQQRIIKRNQLIEQFKAQDSIVLDRFQRSLEDFC